MAASISFQYLSLTAFSAFTSLFFGAAVILESHANLKDLRAEWLRDHNPQITSAQGSPPASGFVFVDTDGDGLADDEEALYDCDQSQRDTDSDGLSDGQEVRQFGTDPRSSTPDRDGDGLTDYAEAVFSPVHLLGISIA